MVGLVFEESCTDALENPSCWVVVSQDLPPILLVDLSRMFDIFGPPLLRASVPHACIVKRIEDVCSQVRHGVQDYLCQQVEVDCRLFNTACWLLRTACAAIAEGGCRLFNAACAATVVRDFVVHLRIAAVMWRGLESKWLSK